MKNQTLINTIILSYSLLLSLIFKNIHDINTLKEKLELSKKNIALAAANYQCAAKHENTSDQTNNMGLMKLQKTNKTEAAKNNIIYKTANTEKLPDNDNNIILLMDNPETIKPKTDKYNIGDLFVLDNLFDNSNKIINANSTSNTTDPGDLFVLNALFNKYEFDSPQNQYDLGDLFVLDELFNFNNNNFLDSGFSSLKDLLILDKLFNK